jgi:hypothetical protein
MNEKQLFGRNVSELRHSAELADVNFELVDKSWLMLMEALRRELLEPANNELRSTLRSYISYPISETLTAECLQAATQLNPRVSKLYERFKPNLAVLSDYPSLDSQVIDNLQDSLIEHSILTVEEYHVLRRRYRFARDIKRLILAAEMIDQHGHEYAEAASGSELEFDSGVRCRLNPNATITERQALLSPERWTLVKQLKDRVYCIEVGGKKYLLKEQKTTRHTDTMRGDNEASNTAEDEYAIGRAFEKAAPVTAGDVTARWERPLGYIVCPDGYQFGVFDFADRLLTEQEYYGGRDTVAWLAYYINRFPEGYQDEFASHQKLAADLLANLDSANIPEPRADAMRSLFAKLHSAGVDPTLISFHDFALVKALRMRQQALNLAIGTQRQLGYVNQDVDGHAFRVGWQSQSTQPQRLELEIFSFDFERYKQTQSQIDPNTRHDRECSSQFLYGINFERWLPVLDDETTDVDDGPVVTPAQLVLFYTMLVEEYPDYISRIQRVDQARERALQALKRPTPKPER